MADWSLFPDDLLRVVLNKLSSPRDHARSSAVCKLWHSIYKERVFPWLMLTDHDRESQTRGFFSLYDQQIYRIRLPELEDKFICGSSHGWFVTIGCDHVIHLLDPFSKTQIQLPPPPKQKRRLEDVSQIKEYSRNYHMKKVIMTSNPHTNPTDSIIMALDGSGDLAYCRLGCDTWTPLPLMHFFHKLTDVIYHKGKFYVVSVDQVFICHIDSEPYITAFGPKIIPRVNFPYLVNLEGDLLLVDRYHYWPPDTEPETGTEPEPEPEDEIEENEVYNDMDFGEIIEIKVNEIQNYIEFGEAIDESRFDIYKLDAEMISWTKVKDIGDQALFLGFNNSLALSTTSFPGCVRNSIYFGDLNWHAFLTKAIKDMGIFLVEDCKVHSFYPRCVFDDLTSSPPIWVIRGAS